MTRGSIQRRLTDKLDTPRYALSRLRGAAVMARQLIADALAS
jgi:hypothetical protein